MLHRTLAKERRDAGLPVRLSRRPRSRLADRPGLHASAASTPRFAGRLIAELSSARLALGDFACFLFTDLANPTSNALYARIGYVKVCDAVEYAFRLEP